jgi:hypothetical protein
VIYYPSIGSPVYPYHPWKEKTILGMYESLRVISEQYSVICRSFRNKWSWSPREIDDLTIARICRIYKELEEDDAREKESLDGLRK